MAEYNENIMIDNYLLKKMINNYLTIKYHQKNGKKSWYIIIYTN